MQRTYSIVISLRKSLISFQSDKFIIQRINYCTRNCSTDIVNTECKTRSADSTEIREAIRKETEITRAHLTPEISLHLLTPNCPLYHSPFKDLRDEDNLSSGSSSSARIRAFRNPFWSIYWPGGQALTRFVLDNGSRIFTNGINTRVLDLGSGCGATAIAAKLYGADEVLANDIDPVACVAAEMNAALNNIRLTTSRDNLITRSYGAVRGTEYYHFDVIFVGDLLYDEEISKILEPWLDQAVRRGAKIYLGDPGRHGLTKDFIKRLKKVETYSLPENVRQENYGFDSATVWQFLGTSEGRT